MVKAVIFDYDGVLGNSENIHIKMETEIIHSFDPSFVHHAEDFAGMKEVLAWEKMKSEADIPLSAQELQDLRSKLVRERFPKGIPLFPDAISIVKTLKPRYKLAIATGCSRALFEASCRSSDLLSLVDAVITSDEVDVGKPSPDIYLLSANKLNTSPKECIVIEDAPKGIKAAKAAGMKCVGITTTFKKDLLKGADIIIKDLSEFPDAIKRLSD